MAGTPVRHRGMQSAVVGARFPSAGLQNIHKLADEGCIEAAAVVGSKGRRNTVVDLVAETVGRSEEGRQAMRCRGEVGALVCADGGRCSIYRTRQSPIKAAESWTRKMRCIREEEEDD